MSSSATDIAVIDVVMPQMGTSITEGTVVAWNKSAGETVEADEPICEISTDKIDSECPSPASGTLVEILVDVGQTVDVGTVIARLATPGAEAGKTAPPRSPTAASCTRPPRPADRRRRGFSPVVQRIAAAHGVDPATVTGTGRGGRVTRSDILVHVSRIEPVLHSESPYRPDVAPEDPLPTPSANGGAAAGTSLIGGTPEPLSRIRQLIGAAMRRSQETSATAHTVVECDMTGVERRRRSLGLTALPIVAHATVQSLREFPDLNATLNGTMITRFDRVHLGVAVSLGGEGLIVPVIWDAQDLSEEGFAERIKDLAGRARTRALGPDDVQGATFTITSPGAAGAVIATPIVPVPQVAILDLEAIVRRPVVVTDAHGAESIAIRSMANLVLGWDHRAIDGMTGAYFLAAIRQRLERLY